MRKLIVFGMVGVFALCTWNGETEACHRGRLRARTWCVDSYAQVPGSPASALQTRVLSTSQFRSPKGLTYRVLHTAIQDSHEETQVTESSPLTAAAGSGDRFRGTDRKAAKTSIVPGADTSFADIAALRSTLPADEDMINDPDISKDADNNRVQREQRNVRVRAFLYAAAKEKDNDFHLILGIGDAANTDALMNSEVSGLPDTGPFLSPLKMVRDQFKAHFGTALPGRSYDIFDPPIPVEVTGSLFFDLDHPAGKVGPDPYKPSTAWEIHPITKIVFEP